jgi:hypothetical protein
MDGNRIEEIDVVAKARQPTRVDPWPSADVGDAQTTAGQLVFDEALGPKELEAPLPTRHEAIRLAVFLLVEPDHLVVRHVFTVERPWHRSRGSSSID